MGSVPGRIFSGASSFWLTIHVKRSVVAEDMIAVVFECFDVHCTPLERGRAGFYQRMVLFESRTVPGCVQNCNYSACRL